MASLGAPLAFPLGGDIGVLLEGDPDVVLIPVELYDPIAGNRGLRGPARLRLGFEEPDGVMPSDAAGNLADLAADTSVGGTTATPSSAPSWSGRGRLFDSANGEALIASDLAGRDTLLQRDVTVQAIIALDIADGDSETKTLIARGIDDGTPSQYRSMRLLLQRTGNGSGTTAEVWWEWQDSTGATAEQAHAEFQLLGAGKFFLLTATRRWEASDKVVVRYYVDERLMSAWESVDGDIGGGTVGQTTIGGTKTGGGWESFFDGVIDELAVYDYEMSPAEVRAVWLRLYQHQPEGVQTLAGLIPPGAPWLRDPSNKIGRRMKVAGQALGGSAAIADELREMFLPDRAAKDQLARWGSIYQVTSRPHESLDLRRSRLLGVTGREEGYSHDAVKEALLELLDVADPTDLEIIEGTNTIEDAFTAIADERWLRGDLGTWSIVADKLRVIVPITSDIRWETQRWGAHIRTSLDTGGRNPSFVQATISSVQLPNDAGAGIMLANRRTNDAIWFGLHRDSGGALRVRHRIAKGGNVVEVHDCATGPIAPITLRIVAAESPPAGVGTFALSYSTDAGVTWTDADAVLPTGIIDLDWGGFGVFGDSSSLASQVTVDFDNWHSFCAHGSQPHHWYAYRDPALGGSPDMIGANRVVQRLKPAHTYAAAIESKSVLAGDERFGLVGRGPMGALHTL